MLAEEIIEISDFPENSVININKMNNNHNTNEIKHSNNNNNNNNNVNFGGGIELLMNDKKKESKKNNIDFGDINKLEDELNELSLNNTDISIKDPLEKNNNIVIDDYDSKRMNIKQNVSFDMGLDNNSSNSNIGKETVIKNVFENPINNLHSFPINPDMVEQKLTNEEVLKEKFKLLRKFEELENKGIKVSKKYSMSDSLDEMKGEYELIISDKETSNNVKFQGKMLMAAITGIEFLNNKFDPFDIKIEGWGEQVNENINDYDDIFKELHEKYKSKAKIAPELKLLFQLAGSAIMVHMTNSMFKSSMPGMDDIMKQNPDLMKHFTEAAINSVGQEKPGFSNFMNDVTQNKPPPEPIKTRQDKTEHSNNSLGRPDLFAAKQNNTTTKPILTRPEMNGPNDVSDILSKLKKKTQEPVTRFIDEGSTISVKDLKELEVSNIPSRTKNKKNKKKSEKTSISLDI
jgi:hypothetical protein